MNLFRSLRERFGALIGVGIGAVVLLSCGLLFVFYLAPRQKLEARRIEQLPLMDAATVTGATPGDELLVTGRLQGDALPDANNFIAYKVDKWEVRQDTSEDGDSQPSGSWSRIETRVPDLRLDVGGQWVDVLAASGANLSGPLHEVLIPSSSRETAPYDSQSLPDGSLRYLGFYDGDLVTTLGKKAASGGILPDELFAGDRVAFVESQHAAAQGLLIAGVIMLVCSPVVLFGGGLAAIFGRRKR
ncbi:MAG: hypothetical protein H8E28_07290 [Anaerolineae bacterium]|nr:hypothetical protein [Anaerolineae bacterium]MBL6964923.1 hypothetical protein [Anaerolineales bacterium]